MNKVEAISIVEKIMHADKVIHQQQLDMPWKPPTDPIFRTLGQNQEGSGIDGQSFKGAESAPPGNSVI